jgi:2,5-diamino-6-(ribosylamino)-4(3H)-pyrimidinone 5'-phosphate reductase
MERPHVTLHALSSVDGRLDGFAPDLGLYYELAGRIPHQAVLTGSATLRAAADAEGVDLDGEDEPRDPQSPTDEDLPWLVVIDSRGDITRLDWLRAVPFWRDVMVLCSSTTAPAHLERLERTRTVHHVVGHGRVDLPAALDLLAAQYAVREVRVDAGPRLNGALLRQDLVDAVSVVVAPYLVGDNADHPLRLITGLAPEATARLRLRSAAELRDDHVWLRYTLTPHADVQPPPER